MGDGGAAVVRLWWCATGRSGGATRGHDSERRSQQRWARGLPVGVGGGRREAGRRGGLRVVCAG